MNILEKGMLDLDEVLTEVEEYQNEGIDKIEELISNIDYTLYSSSNANKIRNAILSAKTNVLKSNNEAEITKIINDLDALIKDVKTKEQEAAELQIEKDAAIKVIYESKSNEKRQCCSFDHSHGVYQTPGCYEICQYRLFRR